jgi:hypothetical protein
MRRSFRAATVFTGAAALAGGFGPMALAATTQATTTVHPDIGPWRECGANNGGVSNWVHLYYPNNDHPAECIGGAGSTGGNATIASFCPGNNHGLIMGSVDGVYSPFPFYASQGRHPVEYFDGYAGNYHVTGILIENWSGHARC